MTACIRIIAAICVLRLCSAQICNVTVENGQTIYRVPPVSASQCDFSWSNATGSKSAVLAHHGGRDERVTSHNVSTLITSGCYDWIVYRCKCQQCTYYQLNCTTICNAKHLPQGEKETGHLHVGVVVLLVLVALVVAAAACFLVYRIRFRKYDSVKNDPESSSDGGGEKE